MTVLDASVAVKLVYEEPESRKAREQVARSPVLAAPRFWLVEAANVLRRKASEGRLNAGDVVLRTAQLRRLPIEAADELPLLDSALTLSLELDHALYDCLYLALAIERGSTLLTADGKFARVAGRGGYGGLIQLIGPDQP